MESSWGVTYTTATMGDDQRWHVCCSSWSLSSVVCVTSVVARGVCWRFRGHLEGRWCLCVLDNVRMFLFLFLFAFGIVLIGCSARRRLVASSVGMLWGRGLSRLSRLSRSRLAILRCTKPELGLGMNMGRLSLS